MEAATVQSTVSEIGIQAAQTVLVSTTLIAPINNDIGIVTKLFRGSVMTSAIIGATANCFMLMTD